MAYLGLGNVYESLGKYQEALEMHVKSLNIKTRILGGDNHLDVAKSYNGIGNVYYSQGQYERALEYYQKSLDIRNPGVRERPPGRGPVLPRHR